MRRGFHRVNENVVRANVFRVALQHVLQQRDGLFGAGRGMETLVRSTLTAGLYGPARFASIYAAVTLFTMLTQAASPVGLGIVYDAVGSYVPGLWVLFGLSCVAAVAVYRGDRRNAA